MGSELSFVLLFAVASVVAMIAKRVRLPYTVALVVTGLVLGLARPFEAPHLTQQLLYTVFLPGLLFEAAYHLELRELWSNKLAVVSLAAPGVIVGILVTGLLLLLLVGSLELEPQFRFIDALVFGGIVAATDPIAVVSLFKSLGAPKRLGVLVEGESLLNDGTAVVVFGLIIAVAGGQALSAGGAVVEFTKTVCVGGLIGGGIGWAVSQAIHRVDDAMIEMTLTTVAAWGSFVLAEQLHVSGVIATVAAGLLCGNFGARTGMSPSTKVAITAFWEYVAFALNSIVFLLIGFEIDARALLDAWLPITVAWLVVMVARVVVVGGVAAALSRTRERVPWSWAGVLCWGGLRGGLSMVLVLALPETFPHRPFLLNMTFGVVLISIVAQGLTMGPLLRRLGIVHLREERLRYEAARASLLAAKAALQELEVMATAHAAADEVLAAVRDEYRRRLARADEEVRGLHGSHVDLASEERRRVLRHLLLVEKARVLDDVRAGVLSEDPAAPLLADIDARLLLLEEAESEAESEAEPAAPKPAATEPG